MPPDAGESLIALIDCHVGGWMSEEAHKADDELTEAEQLQRSHVDESPRTQLPADLLVDSGSLCPFDPVSD